MMRDTNFCKYDNFLRLLFQIQFEADETLQKIDDCFRPFLEKLQEKITKEEYAEEWEELFVQCFSEAIECCGIASMKFAIEIMDGSYEAVL